MRLHPFLLAFVLAWPCFEAHAQVSDLSVEVGGSSISPPLEMNGEDARFMVAGLRALHFTSGGSGILGSVLVGRTLRDATGGDFLSGTLEGTLLKRLAPGWAAGLEARSFGFRVEEPFPYESIGVEGGPSLRFNTPNLATTLKGVAGAGWSRTELRRTAGGPARVVEDELWRFGGTGELLAGNSALLAGLALGIHESSGGTYRSAGFRALASKGGAALELRVDAWSTPDGNETTGGIALILPLGGWSLRGFLGRNEPDPLTLAQPGGGSGGLLVGRSLMGRGPLPPPRPSLHTVVESTDRFSLVEIRVKAPRGTTKVELMGDFTLWETVLMQETSDGWVARVEVPPGTHHFGFLADDEWFVPEDAPDSVPDEWGRRNATIVIER